MEGQISKAILHYNANCFISSSDKGLPSFLDNKMASRRRYIFPSEGIVNLPSVIISPKLSNLSKAVLFFLSATTILLNWDSTAPYASIYKVCQSIIFAFSVSENT